MDCKVCIKCNDLKPIGKFAMRRDCKKLVRKNVCNHCNYVQQTENNKRTKSLKKETRTHNTCIHCKETKPITKFLLRHNSPIRTNTCGRCHFEKWDNSVKRKETAKKWRQSQQGKISGRTRASRHKKNSPDKYYKSQIAGSKRKIRELYDSYIITTFQKNGGLLSAEQYRKHPQLIEAQRANLKLKRKIRNHE